MPQPNFKDLTGKTFNRLTVVKRAKNSKRWRTQWRCKCTCGNIIIVSACHLKNGHTKSCGCLKIELCTKRHLIHGMTKTPEYQSWEAIIQRCNNPNNQDFKDYGGRGITICDEWRNNFMAFFKHIGARPTPKHTIDRINNNSGYKPGNVRWALPQKQANNKRNNYKITLYCRTMTIAQWARFVGMSTSTLWHRIQIANWPYAKAIFQPIRSHKPYSKNIS